MEKILCRINERETARRSINKSGSAEGKQKLGTAYLRNLN
jgi:hypothetical protein